MSKAFTSEETEEAPVVVRPRAPLPPGETNYVTPAGLAALTEELRGLDEAWPRLSIPERQARGRAQLEARLASAVVVDPKLQPQDEVRFGARVVIQNSSGAHRTFQIVGIDEADAREGKVAFVAPLARALLGRKVGEAVTVATPRNDDELTVISIAYW